MAERTQSKSLDALLSANREQFDSLFERQMKAAPPPLVPARRARLQSDAVPSATPASADGARAPTPPVVAPVRSPRSNIKAELNRRFTLSWSSEILEREIQGGHATVRCRLKVGDDARVESGSSRIDEGEDAAAALHRAYEAALQKCAVHFLAGTGPGWADASYPAAEPAAALSSAQQARLAAARARPLDVAAIDQFQAALLNICEEMATVWERGAPSATDPRDRALDDLFGPALITDAQGRMIAGGFGSYVAHMLEQRQLRFAPGDVLLQSDPYLSGGAARHTNDWLVLVPVFAGAELVGFTSMVAHLADVGGSSAGSMSVAAPSIFSEGTRIPLIKICEAGVLNESALQVILGNSRTAQPNRADLLALVAGCRAGASRVVHLWKRLGQERYQDACSGLLARSHQTMCRLIQERIPEEPQSFEDRIDDDGLGNGPFKLRLTVWREGDHAYFDWTGSSTQASGPINLCLHVGLAKMYVGMLLAQDRESSIRGNDGFHDLIHVTLPKGTVVNPTFPAAVGRGEQTLIRHLEVLSSALRRHRPADLVAAGHGAASSLRFAGTDASGVPFELNEHPGGRSYAPGQPSIETMEADFPVVIETCASITDTAGAGLNPGANAMEKIYRLTAPGRVSIHDDRHASRPFGVNGGKAGERSAKWLVRADGKRESLPSKVDGLAVALGDRIVFRIAGGGGTGDPLEREPALVRQDVTRGLLSANAAAAEYGVVLSGPHLDIDARATREARDQLRRVRQSPELFDRGDDAM